jgi:hypothetical protein
MDALHASFPNPLLKPLVTLLVNNGINARKSFLSLCRYQGLPTDLTSSLYDRTKHVTDLAVKLVDTLQTNGVLPSNEDAWTTLDLQLSSPVFSGVMIYALSIHPYASEEEELDILLQMRLKEKDVLDSRQPYSRMNFNVWSGDIDGRLHPNIKPNPRMAYTIGSAILATFQKFQGTVIFPRYSNKPLPSRDISTLKRKFPEIRPDEDLKYPVDLDELYGSKRIRLDGPVEMRQRWYPSQLVPRTYFVSSSTAHISSRFLQAFFNSLCDSLPITNRISRVNVNRLFMQENSEFLFYDLTTFTSRCIATRDFIRWLASQGKGYKVYTRSISEGTVGTTIGDLLEEYAKTVNEFLPWYYDPDKWEGDHGTAGYLGVFGNIASCTFLHGATLGMMARSEDDAGCAGDDAAINTTDKEEIETGIATIGVYEPSKVFVIKSTKPTRDSNALYLKRRVFVSLNGNLQLSSHFLPPSFLFTVRAKPEYSRYHVEMSGTRAEMLNRTRSSVMSSFRTAIGLPPAELASVHGLLKNFYRLHNMPEDGYVPQYHRRRVSDRPFIPSLQHIGSSNFLEETLVSCFNNYSRVPNRQKVQDGFYFRLRYGMTFEMTERPPDLVVLEKLGIVRKVSYPGDFVDYIGEEAITPVLIEYSQGSRYAGRRRRYHVCKPIPDWAWNGEIVEFFGEIVSHDEYKVSLSEMICSRVPERITLYSLQMVLKRKRKRMNTFVMMTKTTMYLLRYSLET